MTSPKMNVSEKIGAFAMVICMLGICIVPIGSLLNNDTVMIVGGSMFIVSAVVLAGLSVYWCLQDAKKSREKKRKRRISV